MTNRGQWQDATGEAQLAPNRALERRTCHENPALSLAERNSAIPALRSSGKQRQDSALRTVCQMSDLVSDTHTHTHIYLCVHIHTHINASWNHLNLLIMGNNSIQNHNVILSQYFTQLDMFSLFSSMYLNHCSHRIHWNYLHYLF